MTQIKILHFAMLTRSADDSDTDSTINLVINQRGVERLNHRFKDTDQRDQERGQANLYRLDVSSQGIDSGLLDESSIRVGILGDDEWRPELLFLWGSGTASGSRPSAPPQIMPLAIETGVSTRLSTDDSGAVQSMPLRPTNTNPFVSIDRLFLVVTTAFDPDTGVSWWNPFSWGRGSIGEAGPADKGTHDKIDLEVVVEGRQVVRRTIPDTAQDDLESAQANLYTVPVISPFRRTSMDADSVRLGISGTDLWLPAEVYLFGFNIRQGRPNAIVPLVHIESWYEEGFAPLSTDSHEGDQKVVLPLVPLPPEAPARPNFKD